MSFRRLAVLTLRYGGSAYVARRQTRKLVLKRVGRKTSRARTTTTVARAAKPLDIASGVLRRNGGGGFYHRGETEYSDEGSGGNGGVKRRKNVLEVQSRTALASAAPRKSVRTAKSRFSTGFSRVAGLGAFQTASHALPVTWDSGAFYWTAFARAQR